MHATSHALQPMQTLVSVKKPDARLRFVAVALSRQVADVLSVASPVALPLAAGSRSTQLASELRAARPRGPGTDVAA